ncbi:MAG: hypothetical protein AAF311_05050 [Pseudomonadota bacterium]
MKKTFALGFSALLAGAAFPLTAQAHCPSVQAGSASISCEQGVRVVRQAPGALPSMDVATVERIRLERKRIAAQKSLAAQSVRARSRLESRRLDLERERVRNEGYLYRDANSPLRARRGRGVIVVSPGR